LQFYLFIFICFLVYLKKKKEKHKNWLFLSSVSVSEKSLLVNAIDHTILAHKRTQAHGQQVIAPARYPSCACSQAQCTLAINCTAPTLELTSRDQPQ
jgi:hypothetical protein